MVILANYGFFVLRIQCIRIGKGKGNEKEVSTWFG